MKKKIFLFDWGDTIMKDFPNETGSMFTWDKVSKIPDADKMLDELVKFADCYIATNAKDSDKEDIIKALGRVNLDQYFNDIFCFKEIGFPKPSKEYYEKVLLRLDTEKENITMVGDNLEKDILGALEFGFSGILFDPINKYPDYKGNKIINLMSLVEKI